MWKKVSNYYCYNHILEFYYCIIKDNSQTSLAPNTSNIIIGWQNMYTDPNTLRRKKNKGSMLNFCMILRHRTLYRTPATTNKHSMAMPDGRV